MDLPIVISVHVLSAIVWVGGMFFAYFIVRPCAGSILDAPMRLKLWSQIFERFFRWVWLAVILLLCTGYWMIFGIYGGMKFVGLHVHLMNGIAWMMIVLFIYLNIGPVKQLRSAVSIEDWTDAGRALSKIRLIVAMNLALGLATAIIATGGKYLV